MNLPTSMMRNMPDRANTTRNYINFMQSIKESISFGNSRSEDFTLKTILLACMTNSYVEGSSKLTGIYRRRQYPHANRIYVHGEHSGVEAIAWIQGLICKVRKDLGHRRLMGECRKPTSLVVQGLADVVVVAMKSPITKRRSEGPLGSGGSLEEGTQDIAGNGYSSASRGSELIPTCMCAPNSGIEAYFKLEGKGICEIPHLKPERGNLEFRNFRGGAGNRPSESCLNGMLRYDQAV